MNILVIGDIVGRPGRRAIRTLLPDIKKEYNIAFTIANGENASGGRGLSYEVMDELFSYDIDVLTMGNHVWDNKEIFSYINEQPRIIRPANYPDPCPGHGYEIFESAGLKILVINLSGRVFLAELDCPFKKIEQILSELSDQADLIIIDFHAEATSEKLALAYYLDGRVNAILGTHTHVQTADERILPHGTAYITDLGMTGPVDSILGMNKEMVINKFLTQRPVRLEVAKGKTQIEGVVLQVDEIMKKVNNIARFSQIID